MPSSEAKPGPNLELRWISLLCLLGVSSFGFYDLFFLHPAYAVTDESFSLIYVQLAREGFKLPFDLFTGSWLRLSQYLSIFFFGPKLWAMHLPILFAFLFENILLWRWLKRRYDPTTALGALLANCLCAFSLLRLRSLISYAVFPAEFLFVLNLLDDEGAGMPFLAGLAAGLFALDYEAWGPSSILLALLPYLGFVDRKKAPGLFLGLGLAWGIGLLLSGNEILAYLQIRSHYSSVHGESPWQSLFLNLAAFFWGGETIPYLAPDQHPAFPFWALPFLLLGIFQNRRQAWLWLWLLIGLAPLLAYSFGAEPNRAMAVWPLFLLLTGLGFQRCLSWAQAHLSPRMLRVLLFAILGFALSDESLAFHSSMTEHYADSYGRSEARLEEARYLVEQSELKATHLLSHLRLFEGAEVRFDAEGLRDDPQGQILAMVSDDEMPSFNASSGSWMLIQPFPDVAPERILVASPPCSEQLLAADTRIASFEKSLDMINLRENATKIYAWLDANPQAAPRIRGALWEMAMHYASLSGDIEESRVQALLKEPLLDALPLYESGIIMIRSRPDDALRLLKRAKGLDPRRDLGKATYEKIETYARSQGL